jgi:phosphoribosylanthranilate isomerase
MPEIKICGITNLDDALHALETGADALGFIFYDKSPRCVAPEEVRAIVGRLPLGPAKVGVFVNHDPLQVKKIVEQCGLDLIQLHGQECPEYCGLFPASMLIKAFSPEECGELPDLGTYAVRAILLDGYDPLRHTGTGRRANWRLACRIHRRLPLILAGGLNAENVQEAIEIVSPDAVDINSGVEISPGRKDIQKVREVIEAVRRLDGEGKRKIFTIARQRDAQEKP